MADKNTVFDHEGGSIHDENGVNVFEARMDALAAKYFAIEKKGVDQILEKGELIVQTEEEFGRKYLVGFYARIGEDPKGATLKKYRKIGENSQRFKPFLDRVPNNWTTVYQLACLVPDKFQKLVDEGILSSTATWKEMREYCVEVKTKQQKKVRPRITLDLENVPATKRRKFVKTMTGMVEEFGIVLPDGERTKLDEFAPAQEE